MTVEVLHFGVESQRACGVLCALGRAAMASGDRVVSTKAYAGSGEWLVLWGPGAPDRSEPMRQQIASGRHVLACDLAYWHRDTKFRIAIDAPHPQQWVMCGTWPAARLRNDGVVLTSAHDPRGPVLVAGIGEKATVQYGADTVRAWEVDIIRQVQASGRMVRYRPKKPGGYVPANIPVSNQPSIDQALQGASCVVTWHSNVAVDAIRLGLPAVCRDGAAAAVCGETWAPELAPLPRNVQAQFMSNLAWFQWAPHEAADCWRFLTALVA